MLKSSFVIYFYLTATERISENMHIVANEPSLAFYRLQEHVRKALTPMVDRRVEVTKLQYELQGRCYDVEYAVRYVPYIPEVIHGSPLLSND